MNQKRSAFLDDFAPNATAYARQDVRQSEVVDAGIAVQESSNTMAAFEYLRARNVNSRVIERVLLEPALRRMADR